MLAQGQHVGDDQLVVRLLAGDEDTYRAVVAEWGPGLLRTARTYLSSRASAEEAVQETWMAVLCGLGGFQGRSSLKTWVFRVLVNTAKSRAAKDARTVPLSALEDEGPDPAAPGSVLRRADEAASRSWVSVAAAAGWQNAPEAALLATEAQRAVACALLRLPPRQRAVVTLRDVHGYTSSETCDLLDLSPVAQRVLLHRGRAALRGDLGSYYAERRTPAPPPPDRLPGQSPAGSEQHISGIAPHAGRRLDDRPEPARGDLPRALQHPPAAGRGRAEFLPHHAGEQSAGLGLPADPFEYAGRTDHARGS
jgi:RNA polymerase sigma-70 factor (ECF subfamily)